MMRAGQAIMTLLAGVLLFLVFAKGIESAMSGNRPDRSYTEDEIAAGRHCIDQLKQWPHAVQTALDARLGGKIDDRIIVSLVDILVGQLEPDATRKLTTIYRIERIGELSSPPRKGTGVLNNTDCSFKLTILER